MKLVLPVSDFNLEHTLECGQAFRWEKIGGFYYGIIGGKLLRVKYEGRRLMCESDSLLDKKETADYFGLNEDLSRILKEIDVDKHIHKAVSRFRGLQILNQEHWECLASFILSSYNNIPRIKKMIIRLSEDFGKKLTLGPVEGYSFPTAAKIAKTKTGDLKRSGLGFRAEYLKDTAYKIASGKLDLTGLEDLNYEEARRHLLSLKGVGEKVADCVLLFSFKRYEAFPVDVWIKRGVEDLYFNGKSVPPKKITEFARGHFGRYAGYAQEYLYHYLRCER